MATRSVATRSGRTPDPAAVLDRLSGILGGVLKELGCEVPAGAAAPELLARLVKDWRAQLARHEEKARRAVATHLDFLASLQAAAAGRKPDPAQAGDGLDIVRAVREVVVARDTLEHECARLRATVAQMQDRLTREEEERRLAARRPDEGTEDERLALYRRAFAEWERDGDPRPLLEEIRERERVFVVTAADAARTRDRLAECLETLAGRLEELYRILPLGEDPRRFRPRRFGGGRYRFTELTGLTTACSDAAGDILGFIEAARQFVGIEILGTELDRLKPAFAEMVRLVADCRQKTAGRATLSAAVSLETRAGMAALPAVLGRDLQELLRGRAGREAAEQVVPLLTDCLALYRAALAKAIGGTPAASRTTAREKPAGALRRLHRDLLALVAAQERHLYEAEARHWELHAGEKALLDEPHLLQRALQDIDAACDVLAVLPGAPAAEFPALPSPRRFTLADLEEPCRVRRRWLAEIARYRVTLTG
jgi:hypothetical protein